MPLREEQLRLCEPHQLVEAAFRSSCVPNAFQVATTYGRGGDVAKHDVVVVRQPDDDNDAEAAEEEASNSRGCRQRTRHWQREWLGWRLTRRVSARMRRAELRHEEVMHGIRLSVVVVVVSVVVVVVVVMAAKARVCDRLALLISPSHLPTRYRADVRRRRSVRTAWPCWWRIRRRSLQLAFARECVFVHLAVQDVAVVGEACRRWHVVVFAMFVQELVHVSSFEVSV